MKLWDKGYAIDKLVEEFTVGNDRKTDLALAQYDLRASLAHAQMLSESGLLTKEEFSKIEKELNTLIKEVEHGIFTISEDFEDVHSKIEHALVSQIGDAGKKIHTARSRNDQILVALHLYAKAELKSLSVFTGQLFERLMDLAAKHQDVLLPGYTHLQPAMPSSFGLWFSAYAETLIDDLILLHAAYRIADQNVLGSAAGYGTAFPINRQRTTELLGFHTLKYNVVAAQMTRGRLEKSIAFALASLASTLSKLSMDVCLYVNPNFGFLSFPKETLTGSSIMPHKQNPDVFELIRAKCNIIQALPTTISSLTTNLPSGYHRDFQQLKEPLIQSMETMKQCLAICDFMLSKMKVTTGLLDNPQYDVLYSVDALHGMVMSGIPFRDAYASIAKQIMDGTFTPGDAPRHTHEGSIGNLCLEEIREKYRKVTGSEKQP